MATFRDNKNREWTVEIDLATWRSVTKTYRLPGNVVDACDQITHRPLVLIDILWSVCRSQAETQNVTAKDFGRSLVGRLGHAAPAFVRAVSTLFAPGRAIGAVSRE